MIYLVCNNANLKTDGIGDYAYLLYQEIKTCIPNIILLSDNSGKKNLFDKLFSLKMSGLLLSLCKRIDIKDVVIIEYPFAECNFLIIFVLKWLKHILLHKNGRLIVSLHEYQRVNSIRKYIIRKILPLANDVLVTDDYAKELCSKYLSNVFLRTIPSNIYQGFDEQIQKKKYQYIFLGLLDKTKAINEMIEAWKIFNKNRKYKLTILSSSEYINTAEDYGVEFYRNLERSEIAQLFNTASFCILPIKPFVSSINATYKTSICFECIPIGCFAPNLKNEEYSIPIENCSTEEILKGLKKSVSLTDNEIKKMKEMIHKVEKPSFRETANQYIKIVTK